MKSHRIATRTRILLLTTVPLVWVAFGAAIASAEPVQREWDIELYDQCMKKTVSDAASCCIISGGVTTGTGGECVAPAADSMEPEAERAPTQSAIPLPETEATLWFPPPPPNPNLPVEPSLSTR